MRGGLHRRRPHASSGSRCPPRPASRSSTAIPGSAAAAARGLRPVRHPGRPAGAPQRRRDALRRVLRLDARPPQRGAGAGRHPRLLPAQPGRAGAGPGPALTQVDAGLEPITWAVVGVTSMLALTGSFHGFVHPGPGRGAGSGVPGRLVRAAGTAGVADRRRGHQAGSRRSRGAAAARAVLVHHRRPARGACLEAHARLVRSIRDGSAGGASCDVQGG